MNPFPVALALLRRNRLTAILFVAVIAVAVALGIAISAQERALRLGTARASDGFDLVVAAPGSQTDLLFSVVYLRPTAVELLDPAVTAQLMAEPRAEFVAPIGFGDEVAGAPVIGTIAAFVDHLSGGLAEGRSFTAMNEAVIGSLVPHDIGDLIEVQHGLGGADADVAADAAEHDEDHDHDHAEDGDHAHGDHPPLVVVGRMNPTGTPWDGAVIVPVEYTWDVHILGTGHAPGDSHIGPPFDPAHLPGLPALVVKPADVAAAYGLRGAYRTANSTAFFPAEVLAGLYEVLGNVAGIMSWLTLAALALVIAAILVGLVAVLDLQRHYFGLLRALGASGGYVVLVVWTYTAILVLGGAVVGLALGWGLAFGATQLLSRELGIAMPVTLGQAEMRMVGLLVLCGGLGALLPAIAIYRRPAAETLRD